MTFAHGPVYTLPVLPDERPVRVRRDNPILSTQSRPLVAPPKFRPRALEAEGAAWKPRYSGGYSPIRPPHPYRIYARPGEHLLAGQEWFVTTPLLVRRIHMRASRRRAPWTRREKINRLV